MRFDCDLPEFPGAFVEFSEVWTRKELAEFLELAGDSYVAFWLRKIIALSLPLVDGGVIVDPAALTMEAYDNLDVRLVYWLAPLPAIVVTELGRLGEQTRRHVYDSYVSKIQGTVNQSMTAADNQAK